MELVEDQVDGCDDEASQFLVRTGLAAHDVVEQFEEPIQRVLVACEQDLLLVSKVVVEVPLFHVQRGGDLLDGRAVVAELAEGGGCALEDLDPRRAAHTRFGTAAATASA